MRRIPRPVDVSRAAALARVPPVPTTLVLPAWCPDGRFDGAVARSAYTVEANMPGLAARPARATVVVAIPDHSASHPADGLNERADVSPVIYAVFVGPDGRARSVHHLSNGVALPLALHDWPPAVVALFSGADP